MNAKFVYDLPTRVFHWLFAGLFVVAFTIGTTVDDEAVAFSYHMIAGIVLCTVVVARLLWGLVGSEHARFARWPLHPRELFDYVSGIVSGKARVWAGHNPASSWAALVMMAFALGLGATGYMMASGRGGDAVEELHEVLANGFLLVVIVHIAGVALHSLRHRDAIWQSMLTGVKRAIPEGGAAVPAYRALGLALACAVIWWGWFLVQRFEPTTRTLELAGTRLQLGEVEEEEHED